ncbi:MAG: hypothetical protein OHK0046_40900 [Anaerolineae bacterium]
MRKYGFSEASWDAIKEEIRAILITLARLRKTIAYSELAMQVQTAYIHHRAPAFDRILQALCDDEIAAGRPILGVLVVNKQTGRCGAGFYKTCGLRGYDVSDPEAFWQAEFARVCDYWEG